MLPNDKKRKGTGFTNIRNILEANRGSRLGQTIASGIGGAAEKTKSELESAGGAFRTAISGLAGQRQKEEQELKDISKGFEKPSGVSGAISPSPAYDPTTQERFTGFLQSQYKGPTELEGSEKLRSSISQTEQLGGLTRDVGGRGELLRRFVGGKDYTRGERTLDTALLGATGQQELSQAARQTRGLGQEYARTVGEAQGLAEVEKAKQEIAKKAVSEQLGSSISNILSSEVNPLLTQARTREKLRTDTLAGLQNVLNYQKAATESQTQFEARQKKDLIKNIDNAYKKGFLDKATRDSLLESDGNLRRNFLNRAIAEKKLSGVIGDLTSMIGSADVAKNLTETGVATEEQASRLSALQKYLGKEDQFGENRQVFKEGGFLPEDKLKEFKTGTLEKENKTLLNEMQKKLDSTKNNTVSKINEYIDDYARMGGLFGPFKAQLDIIKKAISGDPDYSKFIKPTSGGLPKDDEGILIPEKFPGYYDNDNKNFRNKIRSFINNYNNSIKERNLNIKKQIIPRYNLIDEIKGLTPPPISENTRPTGPGSIDTGGTSKYPQTSKKIK